MTDNATETQFVAKFMKLECQNDTFSESKRVERVLKSAKNESMVLGELDHPNISRLIEIYTDDKHFVMV